MVAPSTTGWQRYLELAPKSGLKFTALKEAGEEWWERKIPTNLLSAEAAGAPRNPSDVITEVKAEQAIPPEVPHSDDPPTAPIAETPSRESAPEPAPEPAAPAALMAQPRLAAEWLGAVVYEDPWLAGGHNGYYQAGKFTPAGRILCVDDKNVYSYARKPQYYKWTTPLEHHLFSAPKEAPKVEPSQLAQALQAGNPRKKAKQEGKKGKGKAAEASAKPDLAVEVAKSDTLDPSGKPFTVEAWIRGEQMSGVIVTQGGSQSGYGLALSAGKPQFNVVIGGKLTSVVSPVGIDDSWHHIAGVLTEDAMMKVFVDGQLAAEETGMGIMEDKVVKNHFASEYIYNKYKDEKTCGVLDEEPEFVQPAFFRKDVDSCLAAFFAMTKWPRNAIAESWA